MLWAVLVILFGLEFIFYIIKPIQYNPNRLYYTYVPSYLGVEILLLIVIIYIIIIFITSKSKVVRFEKEANDFMNSLPDKSILFNSSKGIKNSSNLSRQNTLTIKDPEHLVCFECGEHLLIKDKFCPNCGNDTLNELRDFNSNNI